MNTPPPVPDSPVTLRLSIRGLVQGVGFRWALSREARRLALVGWVRNRHDSSVEALVHGPKPAVDALVAWSRHGPPEARVSSVEIHLSDAPAVFDDFEQMPSA